jgi:hypothetical protein
MRKTILLTALAAMFGLLTVAPAHAAGWALTIDTPLSFTFNGAEADTPAPTHGQATWNGNTTTQVSGSKVLLITPIHIGFGYEDYSVRNKVDYPTGPGTTGTSRVDTNIRLYDIALDLPTRFLNFTLGYGQGTANTDFANVGGTTVGQPPPNPIRNAAVTQYFLTVGIPLGQTFDVHIGYHWVTIQSQDVTTPGSAPDQSKFSGQMLSAGLRVNL